MGKKVVAKILVVVMLAMTIVANLPEYSEGGIKCLLLW